MENNIYNKTRPFDGQGNTMGFSKGRGVAIPLDYFPELSSGERNRINQLLATQWVNNFSEDESRQAINALEEGKVLFFPNLNFKVANEEQHLLSPNWSNNKAKNISFDPHTQQLRGVKGATNTNQQLANFLKRFSHQAETLVQQLLPTYQIGLKIARTSFRPQEIVGRKSSYRKDDTRLHVDAFPASPNQGKRILRVFSNINPHGQARVWRLGEPFVNVAQRFLPEIKPPFPGSSYLLQKLHITRSRRTYYDHLMLQIHNRMKKDMTYQQQAPQLEFHFPPGSSWIVMTDHVSHAAMSGQYVLEQTFYLSVNHMVNPLLSPLQTLERLTQKSLT